MRETFDATSGSGSASAATRATSATNPPMMITPALLILDMRAQRPDCLAAVVFDAARGCQPWAGAGPTGSVEVCPWSLTLSVHAMPVQ